jgi:hypothetical protein
MKTDDRRDKRDRRDRKSVEKAGQEGQYRTGEQVGQEGSGKRES